VRYLTTAEVAEELRKSPEWVAMQCRNGALAATKLGNDWRIAETAVAAFMTGGTPSVRKRMSARQARRAS
jgi:excisionase family DNA binding protein